jgi:molecular chaperone GrpE
MRWETNSRPSAPRFDSIRLTMGDRMTDMTDERPDASNGSEDAPPDDPVRRGDEGARGTEVSSRGGPDGLAEELAQLRGELESSSDRYLRLAAEFDNFRKRSSAQLREAEARAQARLVGRLVDVLDDLGRVTTLDLETASVESVLEGVALVERKLLHLLQEAGLEEVDPEGEPFDPNVMEAMVRVPAASEEEDDTVDQVFQKGFRFCGHLVRPARVSVRKVEGG